MFVTQNYCKELSFDDLKFTVFVQINLKEIKLSEDKRKGKERKQKGTEGKGREEKAKTYKGTNKSFFDSQGVNKRWASWKE